MSKIWMIVFLAVSASVAFAQDPTCSGIACLKVLSTKRGTRCGNKPNSVSVDIQNTSSTMYMMGWAIFATSKGPIQSATGFIAPGATMNLYNCDTTADPTFAVNTGPKDKVHPPSFGSQGEDPSAEGGNGANRTIVFPGRPSEKDVEKGPEWRTYATGQPSRLADGHYTLPAWAYQYVKRDEQRCGDRMTSGRLVEYYAVYQNHAQFQVEVRGGIIISSNGNPGYQDFLSCVNAEEAKNYPKSHGQTIH